MSSTIYLIIFIVVTSTLFPLAGYYFDWRHNKKLHKKKVNNN